MPEYSWEDFKNKLQMMEEQGGPFPSAWSPEAIAEAQRRADMMGIAEFRPANNREGKAINLMRLLNILKNGSGRDSTGAFVQRHADRLKRINDQANKSGTNINEMIEEKLRKENPPEKWTPQMAVEQHPTVMDDLYPRSGEKITPEVSMQNKWKRGDINENLNKIIEDDFSSIGYPKNSFRDDFSVPDKWTWDKANNLASRGKPGTVYHETVREKLSSIADNGLIPPKKLSKEQINWPDFPEQMDKVFFSESPQSGQVGFNGVKGEKTMLRAKGVDDLNPDIQAPSGWKWWQTRNPEIGRAHV